MNLQNEETNLPLFKYTPEITSQLLIQTTNDTQEFVQVPNICDDLMLTEIEDGTVTWTLGGLPVLLNDQQQLLLNQLSNSESPTQELQQDIVISDLLNQCANDNQLSGNTTSGNADIVYPLEIPDKTFLTDTGLFTPHSDVINNQSSDDKSENDTENVQQTDSAGLVDEIQSSDVSSQGSFIDINGLLIPQQSVLNLNNQDLLFNLQDTSQLCQNKASILFSGSGGGSGNVLSAKKLKSVAVKSKANVSLLKSANESAEDEEVRKCSVFGDSLIRHHVLNVDGTDGTVLNVNGVLFEKCGVDEIQLAVDLEPDSTVANDEADEQQLNIDDLATVITAYRCKMCEFTCNDREQFFVHFREIHMKQPVQKSIEQMLAQNFAVANQEMCLKKRRAEPKLKRHTDENVQTFKIFCTNGEITNILSATNQELSETAADENRVVEPSLNMVDNTLHLPAVHECIYVSSENGLLQIPIHDSSATAPEQQQQLLCKDLAEPTTDREKKIMRVKRKKKSATSLKNLYRLSSGQHALSLVSEQLLLGNAAASGVVDCKETVAREKQLIYLCSQCAGEFLTVEQCREHMINDHKLCTVEMKPDNEPTDAKAADPLHVNTDKDAREKNKKIIEKFLTQDVLKPRKIKCTKRGCPYRFARPELLARHTACHVDGVRGQFRCPECNELHSSWRLCSVHLWRCHQLDVDMFACPLCTYKGSTYVKLKHHMKIHGDERDYVCPECGRGFKQASQLRNHRVIHLDRQLQEVPKWYVQKHCDKCGKLFADSKCLKKHVQAVHSKLKPFICNVCGHSCARKAMLQMHLRQHTGEKPYGCKLCLYRTGDHNSLRRHVMRHSGTRPYKCPHCTYTAIQSNSYKNHLASKHPGMGGSYSCGECPFKTVNQDTYTSHMNDHRCGLISTVNAKTEVTKLTCPVTMIYDQMTTSDNNSDTAAKNDNTTNTTARNVIIIPGDKKNIIDDDDETQNCFLSLSDLVEEQPVDTGGITIPAESDHSNHM